MSLKIFWVGVLVCLLLCPYKCTCSLFLLQFYTVFSVFSCHFHFLSPSRLSLFLASFSLSLPFLLPLVLSPPPTPPFKNKFFISHILLGLPGQAWSWAIYFSSPLLLKWTNVNKTDKHKGAKCNPSLESMHCSLVP